MQCQSLTSDMTGDLGNKSRQPNGHKPSCSSISAVSSSDFDLLSDQNKTNQEFKSDFAGSDSIALEPVTDTKRKLKQENNLTTQSKETSESFNEEIVIGRKRRRNESFGSILNDASNTMDADFANQSATSSVTSLNGSARDRDKKSIQEAMPIPLGRQRDKEGPD